jgi:hypothetical protein
MSNEFGGVCPLCGYVICDTFAGLPCSRTLKELVTDAPGTMTATTKDLGVRSGRELLKNDGGRYPSRTIWES